MNNFEQRLRSIEIRQDRDFAYLDERSGIIDLDAEIFTAYAAIKVHINTCIRDATTTITDTFKNREHTFYNNNLILASRSRLSTTTLPPPVSPHPLPTSPHNSSICRPRNGNYTNPLT